MSIIGFIGGIAVGWYRLENDKKAKEEAKQQAAEFQKEVLSSMTLTQTASKKKKSKSKKKEKKKKTKVAGENGKSASVTKANPMYVPNDGEGGGAAGVITSIDGGLYDDPAAAPHKCGWKSAAGRTCAQEATDLHCDRHTCTNADCTNGKESKATFCDACDIGSGFGGDANV